LNASAKVIITSSSDSKLETATQALQPLLRPTSSKDTIQTINYTTHPDWDVKVSELTGGKKVDFVIEIGGRATLGKSIRSTKAGGLVAISGYMSDYGKPDEKANQEGTSELKSHCSLNAGLHLKMDETADCPVWFVDLAKMLLYGSVNARGNFVGESRTSI
jgi:NADPH:quinone reductase-like Zn-dependent oxidoreductase